MGGKVGEEPEAMTNRRGFLPGQIGRCRIHRFSLVRQRRHSRCVVGVLYFFTVCPFSNTLENRIPARGVESKWHVIVRHVVIGRVVKRPPGAGRLGGLVALFLHEKREIKCRCPFVL